MRNFIFLLSMFILPLGGISTATASTCNSYAGKVLELTTYDAVEKIVSDAPTEKGEFETTVAFEERVSAFGALLPETFLIGYDLHGFNPLEYDADNQRMKISRYALTGYADYFGSTYGYGWLGPARYKDDLRESALDIVVSETEERTGSYTGSNAFGAHVTVNKKTKRIKVIFERELGRKVGMFVNQQSSLSKWSVPMTIEHAKALKKQVKAAALTAPKAPYYDTDFGKVEPTISSPIEVIEKYSMIIADIQCIFLLDGENKVVSTFTVN